MLPTNKINESSSLSAGIAGEFSEIIHWIFKNILSGDSLLLF